MADSGLSVSLYIDAKKNNEFKDTVGGFTYKAKLVSGEAVIRLDSKMILDRWKGTTRITTAPWPDFEYASTFAPVFLVLDIANNGRRNAQITGTYVDIEASHTDLRPYIQMWANSGICVSDFNLDLSLTNNGWGSARHATLTFAFGDESGPKTKEMVIDVGDLAFRTDLATEDSIKALGVDTDTLTKGDYRCSSEEEYARCLADWKNSDLLAPLKGAVFSYNTLLLTRLWGDLSFSWTDFAGAVHKQTRPVAGDVLLLDVNAALPECGGLSAIERNFATIKLPLDKTNVRIPLKLSDRITPRQEKRYGINLVAEKASHHRFRFVLELADGTTVASPMADLEYFTPRMTETN